MPGSHGSLTKAGKVRFNPNHQHKKKNYISVKDPKTGRYKVILEGHKPKKIPRIRNRRNYLKRVLKGKQLGQPR